MCRQAGKCEDAAMEKHSPRVAVAFFVVALLLALGPRTEAQVKQGVALKTLALGLVFQGAPQPVAERFRPLVEYTGRKLAPAGEIKSTVVVAPSAAELIRLLEAKSVDFYLESPFPTYIINRSGTANLLLRRWKSGMTEYRGILFTTKESRISRLEELRGKMIAFEDAGSTSGYFLPKLLLFHKGFSLVEKPNFAAKVSTREIGYVFADGDKNVVNLVVQGKVAAGAISNDDYASLDDKNKAHFSILAETDTLPRHLVSVQRGLPQPIVQRLKEILLNMHQDDEGQKILRQTDSTTKFDLLPGGEEAFRRKLLELYRPRGRK
jgi:phosphonate transport system substrate-binding protein